MLLLSNARPNSAVVRTLSWYVTWKVAAAMFESPMYCSELARVYKLAGIASFQLSPENTELEREKKREVAGIDGGIVFEISYSAIVRDIASLMTSLRKTAVDVR